MEIEINKIQPDPDQPRKTFDETDLKFLAESILSNGLLRAIEIDQDNVITDGERRWKAHKIAGLKTIRCERVKVDKITKLKRQLISDLLDEELTTGEKYEGIVRLWKLVSSMGAPILKINFAKDLGISIRMLDSALDYCDFSEQEPELAKTVSPYIITETKSLPKEEREEIIREFKNIPKEEKKKDLIREIVKQKKEEIKVRKELKIATEQLSKKEIKWKTDRDRLFQMKEEIYQTQRQLDRLKSDIRWIGKTKFYLNTPKQKDDFIRFIEGAIDGAKRWAEELEELKERIAIEIIKE